MNFLKTQLQPNRISKPGDYPILDPKEALACTIASLASITLPVSVDLKFPPEEFVTPPPEPPPPPEPCRPWCRTGEMIESDPNPFIPSALGSVISLNSDGTIMALGDPLKYSNRGSVIVYELVGSDWVQKGSEFVGLAQTDPGTGDGGSRLGSSVKLNAAGDVLIMAASYPTYIPSIVPSYVEVYYWNGTSWIKKGSTIDTTTYPVLLGFTRLDTVDINGAGDTILIRDFVGCYIFSFISGNWVQKGSTITDSYPFGSPDPAVINSSGNIVVLSLTNQNTTKGNSAGALQAYEWNGSGWSALGPLIEGGDAEFDNFGKSLDINGSGSRVVAGTPYGGGGFYNGYVKVFEYSGGLWTQVGQTLLGVPDAFISNIAINDTGNIIGYTGYISNAEGGEIRMYEFVNIEWVEKGCPITLLEPPESASTHGLAIDSSGLFVIGSNSNPFFASYADQVMAWIYTGLPCPEPPACPPPSLESVLVAQIEPNPDPAPDIGYARWEACHRCVTITADSSSNITSSTQNAPTTNNLDLAQVLVTNNLIPTAAGEYTFIFVFYGWRKWNPQGWISADDKYNIYTDSTTAALLPP
jgi:hypothetical protein